MELSLQDNQKKNLKTINTHSSTISHQKLLAIDGPPIDFSFKNMRKLEQMQLIFNPKTTTNKQTQDQQKPKQVIKPTLSAYNLNQQQIPQITQPKFQIVRTIQIMDSKLPDQRKQNFIKKNQKYQKKNKAVIDLQTTSIFLRYNKLVSIQNLKIQIQKVFPSINQLIWIDLSHNRLTNLVVDFQQFPQLKNLYLHANYISNFKEIQKLKNVKLLRTLTIHANPLQKFGQFRAVISALLPQVLKLDSTLLTKREKQRAQILMKSLKKLPLIKDPQQPPPDSDVQQDN